LTSARQIAGSGPPSITGHVFASTCSSFAREQLGLSGMQVAASLGLSQSKVSRI